MKERIKEFKAILNHKLAFLLVRNSNKFLTNNISLIRVIFHDLGKMINVLLFGDNIATKIHRKLAGHHKSENMNYKQKVEAFCDWECARITKPEKPLNGAQTWVKFYSSVDMSEIIDNFYNSKDI